MLCALLVVLSELELFTLSYLVPSIFLHEVALNRFISVVMGLAQAENQKSNIEIKAPLD